MTSTITGSTPTNSGPIWNEACSIPPPRSELVSADQICSIAFCSATDRPKVAISDGKGSAPTTRLRIDALQRPAEEGASTTSIASTVHGPSVKEAASADADQRQQDHQVAMGDVDDPHDPEHQRHAERVLGVEAAQQDALDQPVNPLHATPPK